MSTVFITGGTKNTGLAVAREFASQGYQVAISSRDQASADRAAQEIEKEFGLHCRGYAMDLKNPEDIARVFASLEKEFGGLDAFVGVAANIANGYSLANSDEKIFDEVMDTNIKGNFFCCREAAEIMKKKRDGAIVLIGSVHNHQAVPGRALYTVSKGAVLAMVHSFAVELGGYGIRVNCLSAGAIHTDRWEGASEEELRSRRGKYPMGRESTCEKIAKGVFFLASPAACTVTGTELTMDSGLSVCLLPFKKPEDA